MKNIITINGEQFKKCKEYPKFYVSKSGKYVTVINGHISDVKLGSKNYNKNGYPLQVQVGLGTTYISENGKRSHGNINLGKLVLLTWVGPSKKTDAAGKERNTVDHIDRNPFNNDLSNLRWASVSENLKNKRKTYPTWFWTPEAMKKKLETRKKNRKLKQEIHEKT